MKVEGPVAGGSVTSARRSNRTQVSGESFATLLDEEGAKTVSSNGVSQVRPVDALLMIQEVGDEQTNRKRARARAKDLLDELDKLRHGLLTGTVTHDQLTRLVALVASERLVVADPMLNELLDEIDLRAQVELAKYGDPDLR